jgi:hypothetical protein
MRNTCLLLVVFVTAASALVTAYHIEPKTAAMSGKASGDPQYGGVSVVIRCCWDELDSASTGYVELFQGDTGTGSQYKLDVYEHPSGPLVAHRYNVAPGRDNAWLRFDRIHLEPGRSFTKGKLYEFRFTRSRSDSAA